MVECLLNLEVAKEPDAPVLLLDVPVYVGELVVAPDGLILGRRAVQAVPDPLEANQGRPHGGAPRNRQAQGPGRCSLPIATRDTSEPTQPNPHHQHLHLPPNKVSFLFSASRVTPP